MNTKTEKEIEQEKAAEKQHMEYIQSSAEHVGTTVTDEEIDEKGEELLRKQDKKQFLVELSAAAEARDVNITGFNVREDELMLKLGQNYLPCSVVGWAEERGYRVASVLYDKELETLHVSFVEHDREP